LHGLKIGRKGANPLERAQFFLGSRKDAKKINLISSQDGLPFWKVNSLIDSREGAGTQRKKISIL